jgi:hypothetical protein
MKHILISVLNLIGGSGSTTMIKQAVEKPTAETNGVTVSAGNSPATVVPAVEETSTPTPSTKTSNQASTESSETTTKEEKHQTTNVE